MIKVVVIKPGEPEREILVEGDSAVVGRLDSCDVVLDKPFVSKQHLRLLSGLVAVDLGSSNGTYLNGRRLSEPALLKGGKLVVGQNGIELRVEVDQESDTQHAASTASAAPVDPEAELENLRSRFALVELEAAKLRRELAQVREGGPAQEEPARLRGENQSLRERVESLKRELEERELEDGGSVQARLARDRMASAQELNEKLQLELERVRAELNARPAAALSGVPGGVDAGSEALSADLARCRSESDSLRAELKRHVASARVKEDQTELVRRLRAELEALRAAALPSEQAPSLAPDLEVALEENRELKAKVAELEGRLGAAGPPKGVQVSDLFFKLQSENSELKRKLAALEKAPAKGGVAAQRDAAGRLTKDLMEARMRITALEAELSGLKVPAPPRAGKSSTPERPGPAATSAGGVRGILQLVVLKDIEGLKRPIGGPAEELVVGESVRFLRKAESVVTRVAGDLIQLFQFDKTMLPDMKGNYRELLGQLLADANDRAPREQLVAYLDNLSQWLFASIFAHRKAALLFAEGLKADLSEAGLTAKEPLPAMKRVPGLASGELWRRAQAHLKQLSPDSIDERINTLARAQAQQILEGKG